MKKSSMYSHLILTAGCLLLFSSAVAAQSFYVDVGYITDSTPSSSFSAAADVPGVWNVVRSAPFTLTDIDGNLTEVSLESSPSASFNGYYHNPGTSGDDSILMDDSGNTDNVAGASNTLTIIGLEAGSYQVYTYAWQPGFPTLITASINVNDTGSQLVEPVLSEFAGYELGENYTLHVVVIGEGEDLNIVITSVADGYNYANYNGFQIIKLGDEVYENGFETLEVP